MEESCNWATEFETKSIYRTFNGNSVKKNSSRLSVNYLLHKSFNLTGVYIRYVIAKR